MGNFNSGGRKSGRGFNRGFKGGFGMRDGRRPAMHQAICSECGTECELPFRPTGDRPVYCGSCFEKHGSGKGNSGTFRRDRRDRSRFDTKEMYNAVCAKCGTDCQVPFHPSDDRPVYCNYCFSKGGKGNENPEDLIEHVKALNSKVDILIKMLTPKASKEKEEKQEAKKESKSVEVVKEKKEKINKKSPAKKSLPKKKKK